MWLPRNEEELQRALESGDLLEDHFHEFKLELGSSPAGRVETARDLASLAIDGGVLIIGIAEDKAQRTFSLEPQPLNGQIEALEQVAALRVDPRLTIHVTEMPSGSDPNRGYLVVVVPPSPSAPHMVQGIYFGRGDRARVRLSDAQVVRYQRARATDGERAKNELDTFITAGPVPPERRRNGHLFLVAIPVTAPPRIAEETAWDRAKVQRLAVDVERKLPDLLLDTAPNPRDIRWSVRNERGVTTTTLNPNAHADIFDESGTVEFGVCEDGTVRVFVGRLAEPWSNPRRTGDEAKILLDAILVAFAHRLVLWSAAFGEQLGYAGAWDLGVAGIGMKGAAAASVETRPQHLLPMERLTFPVFSFTETTRASTWDLHHQPEVVAGRLVGRVLRVIGSAEELRRLAP